MEQYSTFGKFGSIPLVVEVAGGFSQSQRIDLLKQWGQHSQSFSTLQPDMRYFDLEGIGYIAYMSKWGKKFVLSDPVCSPDHFGTILKAFVAKHPVANFIQVSKAVASILHEECGLYATQFGSESRIDLQKWSLSGKKKQIIRTAINQAETAGVTVRETFSDDHRKEISEAWLKTRKCKSNEIRFLIRPMAMTYRENERRFYAYQDGKPVGFIYFDPIYKNHKIVSYVPNISRANADFKQGLFYTIMAHAMEVFKAEGVLFIDLGLIPLLFPEENEASEAKFMKRVMRLIYEKGNFLYNFKGLAFTKTRFRGEIFTTYACHPRTLPVVDFVAMFKLTRLL
jgi:lysylphosphatidylglycerol synthetase-like protein (DUF2156 family)